MAIWQVAILKKTHNTMKEESSGIFKLSDKKINNCKRIFKGNKDEKHTLHQKYDK